MGLSSDSPSGPMDEEVVEIVWERRSRSRENMLSKVDLSLIRVDLQSDKHIRGRISHSIGFANLWTYTQSTVNKSQ